MPFAIQSKKLERKQKRAVRAQPDLSSTINTCSSKSSSKDAEFKCIFCDQPAGSEGLHQVDTKEVDCKVREYATVLQDTNLLAKLATTEDIIALKANYHTNCFLKVKN